MVEPRNFLDNLQSFLTYHFTNFASNSGLPDGLIPKAKKGTKSEIIDWEFDAKDRETHKYGNFGSPTILKLCSKFKKTGLEIDANKVSEEFAKSLNEYLEKSNKDGQADGVV